MVSYSSRNSNTPNQKWNTDQLHISYFGELDECSAGKVRTATDKIINENSYVKEVIFNLSKLTFMDSTGIGMMIGRYKKLKSMGIVVYTKNPSLSVDKIYQISGLYKIMPKI